MKNSTFANIVAALLGGYEVVMIKEYGLYYLPYTAIFFVGVGLICDAIERKKNENKNQD